MSLLRTWLYQTYGFMVYFALLIIFSEFSSILTFWVTFPTLYISLKHVPGVVNANVTNTSCCTYISRIYHVVCTKILAFEFVQNFPVSFASPTIGNLLIYSFRFIIKTFWVSPSKLNTHEPRNIFEINLWFVSLGISLNVTVKTQRDICAIEFESRATGKTLVRLLRLFDLHVLSAFRCDA